MVKLTVNLSEDEYARLRSHVEEQGGDVDSFVSSAIHERLAWQSDEELQARVTESIKRNVAAYEAGQGVDAFQATRDIAKEFGIKLDR